MRQSWKNGKYIRIRIKATKPSMITQNAFYFSRFRKLYFEQNPIKEVEHVLDIGTGTGGSAFVLGKLFPEVISSLH